MSRVYVFADESGNFDFNRKAGATKYFTLVTVAAPDCSVGAALQELRRDLAWKGSGLDTEFHASEDKQSIRDEVFSALAPHRFRIDATIIEKAKAAPSIRATDDRFYQFAWFYHMKHVSPQIVKPRDELLVISASLGTKKQRSLFHSVVGDVIQQVAPLVQHRVAAWKAESEPCLQVADYCAWAIQRKWELGDDRSYRLIEGNVVTEFAIFARGTTLHY